MMFTSFAVSPKHARSAAFIHPTVLSTPRRCDRRRPIPPTTHAKPSSGHFTRFVASHGQSWSLNMHLIPSCSRWIFVVSKSSALRRRAGSRVKTVTVQPDRARYLAMFQVRIEPMTFDGGKVYVTKSSFGRLGR